ALVAQAAERAAAKAKQAAPAPAPSDAVPRAAIDKSKIRRALPLILACTGFLVLLIAGLLLLINSIGRQPEARTTDPAGLTQSVPTNPPSAGPIQPSDAGKDDWHLSDFRDDRDGRSLEAGGSGANIQRLAFSPDGKLLAVGGRGGVQLYGPPVGKIGLWLSMGDNFDVSCLAFSSDGKRLAAGAYAPQPND